MDALTSFEKRFLALALVSRRVLRTRQCRQHNPATFDPAREIARKLEMETELNQHLPAADTPLPDERSKTQ